MMRSLYLASLVAALLACAPAVSANDTLSRIVPHVAHYRIGLGSGEGASTVKAIRGRLEIHVDASCDGFTVQQFMAFNLLAEDDAHLEHLARMRSFESRDGREMIFTSETWENREKVEEVRGRVERLPAGVVEAHYTMPEPRRERLPAGTLFPSAHIAALIDVAERGDRQLTGVVFDGTSADGPFEVASAIGSERRAREWLPGVANLSDERRLWPVRLAYFPPGSRGPLAEFEMSAALLDNGVIADMRFDYGDFVMAIDLEALELEVAPKCSP